MTSSLSHLTYCMSNAKLSPPRHSPQKELYETYEYLDSTTTVTLSTNLSKHKTSHSLMMLPAPALGEVSRVDDTTTLPVL